MVLRSVKSVLTLCKGALDHNYGLGKVLSPVGSSWSSKRQYSTRLSPLEVTSILRANENSEEVNLGSIKSFETNQLHSNTPIEDTRAEARCLLTTGLMFGIFDGHGGPACAQVVAKRIFNYIAASLLPSDVLHKLLNPNLETAGTVTELLETYNDRYELVEDLRALYSDHFKEFLHELSSQEGSEFSMRSALERAFLRLDEDIIREAKVSKISASVAATASGTQKMTDSQSRSAAALYKKTISIAVAGAVGAVAHIDGEHLHVANCGDCQIVLGSRTTEADSPDGLSTWEATVLTTAHNSENALEVERILMEHPPSERDRVIANDRLLGQLAPLRAFGDVRFKWTSPEIREFVSPFMGAHAVLQHSLTPPYLTARPEVAYHRLRAKDSFIIIGSDGLWDMLSPSQAVRLVGEHMSGKTVLSPYSLPKGRTGQEVEVTLGTIHETLKRRTESFKLKPIDSNAATHLIRHALSGTTYGLDHNRISYFLTMPEDTVRLFRDDITATIVFFDFDYLTQRPL